MRSVEDRQRDVISASDSEALLKILGMRQRLVNELMRINRQLAPSKDDWEQIRVGLSADEREKVETTVSAVREELSWILNADQKDSESLSVRRGTIAREMATLDSARRAVSAYQPVGTAAAPSRYLDQTDEQ